MDHPDPRTALDLLVKRSELLDLFRSGAKHKGDLVDEADVSRSTVDRALRDLELAGFVDRTGDGFVLTLCGRLMLSEYESFVARLENLCRSHALIAALPAETSIEPALLDGAEITLPEPQVPMKPLVRFEELIESASRIRGFSPAVLPSYVDLFHRRVTEEELSVELILESGVVRRLATNYAEELGAALDTGRVAVREAPQTLPFGLVVTGAGEVGVVIYDESGIAGVITNDREDAYEWAMKRYGEVREAATVIHRADG